MDLGKLSFGATSAIITSVALIVGLGETAYAKASIIGALLVIAIADNFADSLGFHIYRESTDLRKNVNVFTITNFTARLIVTFIFICIVVFLPITVAMIVAIVFGLFALSLLTYFISMRHKINPWTEIPKHLLITILVIIISHYLGTAIKGHFRV